MIIIKNVSKSYVKKNEKFVALDDVNIKFPDKGLFLITGESGAGKSTLLSLIGKLDDFDKGEIIVDGVNLSQMTPKETRFYRQTYIGFVFQQLNLISELTVYENVKLANDLVYSDDKELFRLFQLLKIENLKNKKINELSGGEQQKVAIARALIKKPKILLCDEPTGMLDKKNSKLIFEILKEISSEILVLVVTHNVDLAKYFSNKIIELECGNVLHKFEDYKEQSINHFKFKQNKNMSLNNIFRISFSWMKIRFKRIFFIAFMLFILLTTSITSLSFIFRDDAKIIVNSIYDSGAAYMSYYKTYNYIDDDGDLNSNYIIGMNDNDIIYLKENLNTYNGDIIYNYYDSEYGNLMDENNIYTHNEGNYKSYNTNKNNGLIVIDHTFIEKYNLTLYGRLPENDNEVIITKYIFEQYKLSGYYNLLEKEIVEFDDLIGEEITLRDNYLNSTKKLIVVGVLDTKLNEDKYKQLLNFNENNKFLQIEWDNILEYGLHNIAYVNQKFINELKNDLKIDYTISLGTETIDSYAYKGIKSVENSTEKIYYVSEVKNESGIIIPHNFNFSSNYGMYEKFEKLVKTYAEEHYVEIREDFIKDGNEDSWGLYYTYILNNKYNKYNPDHNYNYFKDLVIYEICGNLKEVLNNSNILKIYATHGTILKDVEVIGFYDIDGNSNNSINSLIYTSETLFNEIFSEINSVKNQYKFIIQPLSEKKKDEKVNLELISKKLYDDDLLPQKMKGEYVTFETGNETYAVFNSIDNTLKIISIITVGFSILLLIILLIVIFYHFSGAIQEKIKNIGILYSMGTSVFDIFKLFFIQLFILLIVDFIISTIVIAICFTIFNNLLFKQYQIIMAIFNMNLLVTFILFITCMIVGILLIYSIVYKYNKKNPIKTILTLM